MAGLDVIAEQRIRDAQARGEFDDLPGTGTPLNLDDDALVPEELRAAYRVLKNSGFLPAELENSREIRDIELLIGTATDESTRARLLSRISYLLSRRSDGRPRNLQIEEAYIEALVERLGSRSGR